MNKIKVGDKVQRNAVLAIFDEEIVPDDMDLTQVYEVESVHKRVLLRMHCPSVKYTTVKLEGLEGEINVDLIDKIESGEGE